MITFHTSPGSHLEILSGTLGSEPIIFFLVDLPTPHGILLFQTVTYFLICVNNIEQA